MPTIAKESLFVNNSLPASLGERRGKQGGSHDVRSHVSRRSRLEKRERKLLERQNEEKSRCIALAPRLRPNGELEVSNDNPPNLEPDAGHQGSSSEEEPLNLDGAFDKQQATTLSQTPLAIINNTWTGRVKGVVKFDPFSTFPTSIANASTLAHELVDIGK